MPLSPEQIEHIKRLKREFGIDEVLGATVSQQTRSRGHFSGIQVVSADEGRKIVERTFNPVVKRIIEGLEEK